MRSETCAGVRMTLHFALILRRILFRRAIGAVALCVFASLSCLATWGAGQPGVAIGNRTQLFIDDSLIESTRHVQREAHAAEKYFPNPVLTYTRPWEGHCVIAWGSVLYDEKEQLFKMWYEAYRQNAPPGEETFLLYATSHDGIYWDKPSLNLIKFHGLRANNIVFHPVVPFDSCVVVRDDSDPKPGRRYKMMCYLRAKNASDRGAYGAVSADGIHW